MCPSESATAQPVGSRPGGCLGSFQGVGGVVDIEWARSVARAELSRVLPRRWSHTQGVEKAAVNLSGGLPEDAAVLLRAAAVLHDIGYAPKLARTGFHPLDGARFLRDEHEADERLTRLVANHSCALLEAEERGLRSELETEFPLPDNRLLVDALIYADMTTTPDGQPTTPSARISEIVGRYGPETLVGRFIQRATPEIMAASARVELALLNQPR
ncbi:HD domain-containing protein [Nocardia sp. GTS18]|uniref:HD domain-containing protein n=1 Tax=Nocardia sp. GTS18 TaxID=1778064 RepID=UPI0015EF18A3|nr:HD domain-containing protein [Nocardia sp. GTS18]